MSKMKTYKITLEPLDWFFFGGESTFDNSVKTSYIAHSNKFPQQAALLGMVRYQLLKQEGMLSRPNYTPDPQKVTELIGGESFSMEKKDQCFGNIKALSPVFIEKEITKTHQAVAYIPSTLTYNYHLSFEQNVRVSLNGKEKECLICDNDSFDEKKYNNFLRFKNKNGDELMLWDIFETRMQVGITKNTDYGQDNDNRFFKREMVRFKKDEKGEYSYRFAFYVDMDTNLKNDYVYLGAERSCFKMTVTEQSEGDSAHNIYMKDSTNKPMNGRIEILSPTYVEEIERLNELCDFHWSFQTPFRNIIQVKNGKGKLNSGNVSYNRVSICYNMLCPGTVLFFKEDKRTEIVKLLNNEHLKTIGYNFF